KSREAETAATNALPGSSRRADVDPEQRHGHGDEPRPDEHDGRHPAAPAQEALGERVEMAQHPEAEEGAAQQLAPLRELAVERARRRHGHGHRVHHHDRHGRHHQEAPPHLVQLRERVLLTVVAGAGLGRQSEGDVHAGDHLEQTLQHGSRVRAGPADHPELLVAPPLVQRDPRPLDLQHRQQAEREGDDEQERQEGDVERLHNELAGEEGDGRQHAVDEEEDGGERATRWRSFIRGDANRALFREKKISTDPVAHRSTWCRRSVRLMGAVPRNASRRVTQYTERHPRLCIRYPVTTSSVTDP
ncbi:hypothetical protein U9M48_036978, partial [Paspalum notatum var. saurae]